MLRSIGVLVTSFALLPCCQAGPTMKIKLITAPPPTVPPTLGAINREHVNYKLTPRVPRANFTGPPALRSLFGECFPDVIGNYEWRVCPFDNVTQHQVNSGAWSTFNGIIGVWKGYDVVNGTVSHLVFEHGDNCAGEKQRSARVSLVCGAANQTMSASEPAPCEYELVLQTPLACNGSLDIHKMLDNETLAKVRIHDLALANRELTHKGHNARVKRTLEAAGFFPGPPVASTAAPTTAQPTMAPTSTTTAAPTTAAPTSPSADALLSDCISHIAACNDEKSELAVRVDELTEELETLRTRLNSILSLAGVAPPSSPPATGLHTNKKAAKVDTADGKSGHRGAASSDTATTSHPKKSAPSSQKTKGRLAVGVTHRDASEKPDAAQAASHIGDSAAVHAKHKHTRGAATQSPPPTSVVFETDTGSRRAGVTTAAAKAAHDDNVGGGGNAADGEAKASARKRRSPTMGAADTSATRQHGATDKAEGGASAHTSMSRRAKRKKSAPLPTKENLSDTTLPGSSQQKSTAPHSPSGAPKTPRRHRTVAPPAHEQ